MRDLLHVILNIT